MSPSSQILTVAQVVAAEQALIDGGETVSTLMELAGAGAAEWVWRLAAGRPVKVLCGPGNNGGDGYVIARELMRRGATVSVHAVGEPATEAAQAARASYEGPLDDHVERHSVVVDCLFGSGLSRPLDPSVVAVLQQAVGAAGLSIAVDLPSGIESDSGQPLNPGLPSYDVTLALGAWKFAHWLMPAMAAMGERRLVPIGVAEAEGAARLLERPKLAKPAADAHKYNRGLVLVVGGQMQGAALLACEAAMRAGAGTVRLAAQELHPAASLDVVLKPQPLAELLGDKRSGSVLVGPGLGRDAEAWDKVRAAMTASAPIVADADALWLLAENDLGELPMPAVVTPHEGEFGRLFGDHGSKVEATRMAARRTGVVIVRKGPDTVIAAPDGRTVLAPSPTSWLAAAGTGDVLAGIVASRLASGAEPFAAACEAVWLHGAAARLAGPDFTASELARHVAGAYAAAL
jgi:hydroxyethylthiazole kinase-like uncharacterized protein yjeF